ncbi:MAG: hypothetical protein AAFQ90_09140 [Pseudomonadota bacterium]
MSARSVRIVVAVYLAIFLAFTTWPGATLLNSVRPFILGLPFNLFCIALLIVGGLAVLAALYASEKRADP